MFDAVFWGLIQGLTEFLPVSSSGHLVLVPELFGREGPDLATSALLHLGTLTALIVYFRRELSTMVRRTDEGRRLLGFVLVGSLPAVIVGFTLRGMFDRMNERPAGVAIAMIVAGVAMVATRWLPLGVRVQSDAGLRDGLVIGIGQAFALIPGVSRSGTTIGTGMARGFERRDAASLAFILGIPAMAGAGLLSVIDLAEAGGAEITVSLLVGMVVAGVVGYAAIAGLLGLIRRTGLAPFGVYCVLFGTLSLMLI